MKKIDDKILNEPRVGDEEIQNQDGEDVVTCDCCNLSSSSPLSLTESEEQEHDDFEQIHDDDDRYHHEGNK